MKEVLTWTSIGIAIGSMVAFEFIGVGTFIYLVSHSVFR